MRSTIMIARSGHQPDEIAVGVRAPCEPYLAVRGAADDVRRLFEMNSPGAQLLMSRPDVRDLEINERAAITGFATLRAQHDPDSTGVQKAHLPGIEQRREPQEIAVERLGCGKVGHGQGYLCYTEYWSHGRLRGTMRLANN